MATNVNVNYVFYCLGEEKAAVEDVEAAAPANDS